MLSAFVCALLAFHAGLHRASCADSPPCLLGCFQISSSRLQAGGGGVRDLDPAGCTVRCLDEGYQVAALSSHTRYCGNGLNGFVVTECFHTSSNQGTKEVKRGSERQSSVERPPAQDGDASLHSVSVCPGWTGDAVVLLVSGRLAGRPRRPTGNEAVEGTDLSEVTVELRGTRGQSSRRVKALSDGSFQSTLGAPGDDLIAVQVSSTRSTLSACLHLSISPPPPSTPSSTSSCVSIHCASPVNATEAMLCVCASDHRPDPHRSHSEQRRRPRAAVIPPLPPASSQSSHHSTEHQSVRIHTEKQAYPTNAAVTFQAVVEGAEPAEFVWRFGDSTTAKSSLQSISKTYSRPGSYDVVVEASVGGATVVSDAFPVVVQRAVRLNRLVHQASVLRGQPARLSCRVDAGTELGFAWSFGDGASRAGRGEERHVYNRTGEFRVEVTASNRVSSASLSSRIFVVDRPCQPPSVKNMGPRTLKVWRSEVVRLGVTFDRELACDASEGLRYSWTLLDSAGRAVALPRSDARAQSLTLHGHVLQHDTYTAVAKVQVAGSQVYSQYSVRLRVMAGRPVAFIQGGTNVFISRSDTVTLDGGASYDPDAPSSPLSFSWTCEPVSSIATSCFHRHVGASAPVLRFAAALLKRSFDQFHFTLTVHSGGRSASAETFVTVSLGSVRTLSILCSRCRGDRLTWDQPFSVRASCPDCGTPDGRLQYSWTLQQVDAPSRPAAEAPFCHSADLGAPSAVVQSPTQAVDTQQLDAATSNWRGRGAGRRQPEPPAGPLDLDSNSRLSLERSGQSGAIRGFPAGDGGGSADGEVYWALLESGAGGEREDPDHDVHFAHAEEGDPGTSAGRPSGGEDGSFDDSPLRPPLTEEEEEEEEGSKLVAPKLSVVTRAPTLLDLPREPVSRGLFESYTYSGTSSSELLFRPFSLRPHSRYMLEVTARSQNSLLGRAQLFVRTAAAPGGVACQVQPGSGAELTTVFSIFCTSGREDLLYQYSYSVAGRPPRVLYQGRDFQYYFSLPAGDPRDDLKVTVYTEIRSGADGSATRPCPVTVRVRPSFLTNASSSSHRPDEELSAWARRNLTALLQLGNEAETRNYISLLSSVLSRLGVDAQRRLRNLLVHTVCELPMGGEVGAVDSIALLTDLLQVTHQVTFSSARRVAARVRQISEQFSESGSQRLDQRTLGALIGLLSFSLQAATGCETPPVQQLEEEVLQSAAALMLESLSNESQQATVHTGLLSFNAAPLTQTPAVVTFGSSSFHVHAALIQAAFGHRDGERRPACVLRVLDGPVVELSLYSCSSRRKIPVRSLAQPISTVLTLPLRNSSRHQFQLLRGRVNYHSFNVSQELLQQHAVQLSVLFTPPPSSSRAFPIMLLFSMFERPTPSMHHLSKIHQWRSDAARITLPPSHLSAAGVAHLALLEADFERTGRRRQQSEPVSYSVSVVSSLCVSWSVQQGAWTHRGCRTQQSDSSPAVSCSCRLLRPLTVVQQQIQSSAHTAEVDPFLSSPSDLTALFVVLLLVILSVPAWAACRRADAASEGSRGVHYLSDNAPSDQHLYLLTVHTGLRSAARMSAKVYIVLHGEDGVSQTKELRVPGCTLFRRNSQDSFILSAAGSLGAVRGAHIWHDSSGPSPDWYLSRVEVSELSGHGEGRAWLIRGQCWLAGNRADGRVERMLRVTDEGSSFTKVLCSTLCDYFADFHIWASVLVCPSPSSLTHTQRLSVCLLLLSGYACANTVIISQMDPPLEFESSFVGVSPVSVLSGLASVAVVLPVATWTSLLFRRRGAKPTGSGAMHAGSRETEKEDLKDVSIREEDAPCRRGEESELFGGRGSEGPGRLQAAACGRSEGAQNIQPGRSRLASHWWSWWSCWWSWTVCLLASLCCLLLSAVQGTRFSGGAALLWLHALLVSLTSCIFLVHPAVVLAAAVAVSCCRAPGRSRVHSEAVRRWSHAAAKRCREPLGPPASSCLEKQIEARRRARFLRRVQPPSPATLRRSSRKRRRDELIHQTLRELSISVSMLLLLLCIARGCSHRDHRLLNAAVAKPFTREHQDAFMSVQTREQWWTWTQTSLLDALYEDPSAQTERRVLVGEPVLEKTETSRVLQSLVSMETRPRTCGHPGCSSGPSAAVGLGRTRSDAASRLKRLRSAGWLDGAATVALKVQFTVYSPACDLLTSVSLLAERSPSGVLLPSASVQSARVGRTAAAWDRAVQVLFLLLSLLRLCLHVSSVWPGGPGGRWRRPSSWSEVGLLTVTLLHYVHYLHHAACVAEVLELLQSHDAPVDVGRLAACEQLLRALCGVLLLLLTLKCATALSVIRIFSAASLSLSSFLWPVISGLILLAAASSGGTLLYGRSSQAFSTLPRSLWTLLRHYWSPRTARGPVHSGSESLDWTLPRLSSTLVWTAVVVAVMSSVVREAKQSHRKRRETFTFAELMVYVRKRLPGRKQQQEQTGNLEAAWSAQSCDLQEFESAVDELLLRLDSLHRTLALEGGSPPGSSMDAQMLTTGSSCVGDGCVSNQEDVVESSRRFRTREHGTDDDPEEQREQEALEVHSEVLVEVLVHDAPARLQECV